MVPGLKYRIIASTWNFFCLPVGKPSSSMAYPKIVSSISQAPPRGTWLLLSCGVNDALESPK